MPEDLTADELVKLAELCGYRAHSDGATVWLPAVTKGREEYMKSWRPHLDANQRDEVVNSICKNWPDLCVALSRQHLWAGCEIVKDEELIAYKQADTAGLAVCRAVLKALER
jgi:hypothetical protein